MDFEIDTPSLPAGAYTLKVAVNDREGQLIQANEHPVMRVKSDPPPQGDALLQVDVPKSARGHVSDAAPLPVYAGVPAPRGWSMDARNLQLYDKSGALVPSQVDALATWRPRGSLKWLGLHFQLKSSRARDWALRLSAGKQVNATPAGPRIETETTETSVIVNTGPLQFEVLGPHFDGIHQAWLDLDGDGRTSAGESLFPDAPDRAPYVVDQNGKVYRTCGDANSEVRVEVDGPLCTIVRASGWYAAEDGARICRHVTRIVAYAGLSWVRLLNTFIFAADSREVKLADVGIPFALKNCSTRYRFGVRPRDLHLSAAGTSRAYLLQHEKDAFALRTAWPDGELTVARGARADGWLETANDRAAVAVGLRDFWQTYPKELEAHSGRIIVHIWPKHGEDKPSKALTEENLSELWFMHHRKLLDFQAPEWFSSFTGARQRKGAYRYVRNSARANGMGVARSCELFVNFRDLRKDTTPAVSAYVNHPPVAAAAPEWMCRSGVFGPTAAVDSAAFPVIERAMDARFDGERSLERFSFGMWNYGGSVTYFQPLVGSYDQIERPWRLTHHGGPRAPWLLFARSGKRKFFEYAARNSLRCADIAFCHYSTPAAERGQGAWGRKVRGAQCDYKGIVPWSSGARIMDYNSMADFLHYLTYFTGNRWPFEVALEWGECTKKRFRPREARSASGTLDTLLSLYEATWDPDYRELAERQFLHLVDHILTPDGYFKTGNWYDYAPWLSHYHRLTGSRKAQDAAVRWGGRIIRNHWLGNQVFGDDTSFDRAMGYPLYDVFRLAYEGTGDKRFLEMALGCARVVGVSVMLDAGSRLYGMDMYSGSSTGGYFEQTVPVVLPLLKERRPEIRALFPRWRMHTRQARLFVRGHGSTPLELRVHFTNKPAATFTITPPGGEPSAPQPVEIVEEIRYRGGRRDNAKTAEMEVFARVVLPARLLDGPTEIVFNSGDGAPFGMFAPIQLSRPAQVVFAWDADIVFARGSAMYFRTPEDAETVRIRGAGIRWSTPLSLALLDGEDTVRALEQWFPPERPGAVTLEAELSPADRGQVWCCLQGLSKAMAIDRLSADIPPYFADRPQRFFVPERQP